MLENNTPKAVIWGIFGTFLFTIVFASGKLLDGEVNAFQILFLRYVSGFGVLVAVALITKKTWPELSSSSSINNLFRALSGSLGGICIIHATTISPIADVTAISLTDALLTMILSIIFLKEVVVFKQWVGAAICAFGSLVITYGVSDGALLESLNTGILLAFLGALLIAIESILIKVLSSKDKILTILLYSNFFSIIILFVPAMYVWTQLSLSQTTLIVALGPIAIIAQLSWVIAYRYADAALVTPVNYSWVVFASLLGYFYFNEPVSQFTILGSLLIISGGLLLSSIRNSNKSSLKIT